MAPSPACSGSTAADAISPATRPVRSRRTHTHSTSGNAASSANGDDRPAAAITRGARQRGKPQQDELGKPRFAGCGEQDRREPAGSDERRDQRHDRHAADLIGKGLDESGRHQRAARTAPQRPAGVDAPAPARRPPSGEPAGRRQLPDWQANHGIWRQVYSTQRTRTCTALRIGFWLTPKLASSV